MSENTRYLFVPDLEITADKITTTSGGDQTPCDTSGDREEAGASVRQPTAPGHSTGASLPGGDMRLTLSGEPDDYTENNVRITRSGPVDKARFGWVVDPATEALQFRQSCSVVGRRPDILHRDESYYLVRPKALSLADGRLLVWWIAIHAKPMNSMSLGFSSAGTTYQATWLPDGTWSVQTMYVPRPHYAIANQVMGVDAVQFPDTEEVLLFHVVNEAFAIPQWRQIYIHASQDGGTSWENRSILLCSFSGVVAEPDVQITGYEDIPPAAPTEVDDNTAFTSCAAEILNNGRVVLCFTTRKGCYSIVSDDRGVTWSSIANRMNTTVTTDGEGVTVSTATVCLTKARNGTLAAVFAHPNVDTAAPPARPPTADSAYASADGENWGGGSAVTDDSNQIAGFYYALSVRPDGWPQAYFQMHQYDASSLNEKTDWILSRTLSERDLDLNILNSATGGSAWFPRFESDIPSFFPMHGVEVNAGLGDFGAAAPEVVYAGFAGGLDAVEHRGETWLITSHIREDTSGGPTTSPSLLSSAVVCYRTSHWQPLQERLGYGDDTAKPFSANESGRLYNFTWDPYEKPNDGLMYGLVTTGGTTSLSDAFGDGTNAGYAAIDTVAQSRYYSNTSLPNPNGADASGLYTSSISGVLRFFVAPTSGGSVLTNDIAVEWVLADIPGLGVGGSSEHGVDVRFERAGVTTTIQVWDYVSGGGLGTISLSTPTAIHWFEVVVSLHEENAALGGGTCSVYIRELDYATDPDLVVPYTTVVDEQSTTYAVAGTTGDLLSWGHIAASTAQSLWKGVYLSRVDKAPASTSTSNITPLDTFGNTYRDEENFVLTAMDPYSQLGLNDAGVFNNMRTSQATAIPPQRLLRGVKASFRGEATLTGSYTYETGYDYGGQNLLEGPTVEEWRSSTEGLEDIEIIIDVGDNVNVKPTGFAIFGRNWTSCRLQLNDTNSWVAPRVDVTYGTPNDLLTPDRYTHLWSSDESAFITSVAGRNLVCVSVATGGGPWRTHQFKSQETGPNYYAMIQDTGTGSDASRRLVYRILDNDEGKLLLEGDPEADGVSGLVDIKFDVFSDRFAAFFGDRQTVLGPVYRFIRLLVYGVNHRDRDGNIVGGDLHNQFQRIGRIVLGHAHDLSGPMFDWGWSRNESSGQTIVTADNGVRYARRMHSPRRSFQCTYKLLRAPLEADAVNESPATQWRSQDAIWAQGGGGTPKTWGHVLDLIRRLEMDGKRAALVWDGDRASESLGASSSVVQTAADPLELLMVRVANVGNMKHVAYEGQIENLADDDACRPTPMMTQTITFEEDF